MKQSEASMRKALVACAIAAAFGLAATGAQAQSHGGRGGGGHGGGGHWSGGHSSGGHWNGGHGGNWGHYGRGRYYGGHGGRWYGSINFGWPGYYWPYYGAPVYYDSPAYTYYDYPMDEVYVERVPPPAAPPAQYYCPDTGYYPTVQACPQGWLRVLPGAPPPQ
jgi:hypothetical protein